MKAAELTALAAMISFIVTAMFVYGCSIAVGMNLLSYFSLTDYLIKSVQAFVPLLVNAVTLVLGKMFIDRINLALVHDKRVERSKGSDARMWWADIKHTSRIMIVWLASSAVIVFAPASFTVDVSTTPWWRIPVAAGIVVGWITLSNWLIAHDLVSRSGKVRYSRLVYVAIPPYVALAIGMGYSHGEQARQGRGTTVIIRHDDDSVRGNLLFNLDRGVLIVPDTSRRIVFVPYDFVDHFTEFPSNTSVEQAAPDSRSSSVLGH